MSAPSSITPIGSPLARSATMRRGHVLLVGICLCVVACAAGNETVSSNGPGRSMSAPSMDECEPAPAWIVERLEQTLAVRGATLSRLYAGPATNISGGPAEVHSDAFRSPSWVAAMIAVGVRPEVGVWLVSGLKQADPGLRILPADIVAQRYSLTSLHGPLIEGDGLQAVRSCVGTPPEP
jgi:hypothetical protein